jgi:hypothetical protein
MSAAPSSDEIGTNLPTDVLTSPTRAILMFAFRVLYHLATLNIILKIQVFWDMLPKRMLNS